MYIYFTIKSDDEGRGTDVHSSVQWGRQKTCSPQYALEAPTHGPCSGITYSDSDQVTSFLFLFHSVSLLKTWIPSSCFLYPCFQCRHNFCCIQHYGLSGGNCATQRLPSSCWSWTQTLPLNWTSWFHSLENILFFSRNTLNPTAEHTSWISVAVGFQQPYPWGSAFPPRWSYYLSTQDRCR